MNKLLASQVIKANNRVTAALENGGSGGGEQWENAPLSEERYMFTTSGNPNSSCRGYTVTAEMHNSPTTFRLYVETPYLPGGPPPIDPKPIFITPGIIIDPNAQTVDPYVRWCRIPVTYDDEGNTFAEIQVYLNGDFTVDFYIIYPGLIEPENKISLYKIIKVERLVKN